MLLRHAPTLVCATALFGMTMAQSTASVPTDLSSAFDPNSISMQVSYNDNSAEGLKDGTKISQKDTSKAPVFALGDSSGVNTVTSYLILLLDTTTLSNRTLHFLQTDFKADGEKTSLSSKSQPAVPYRGPGAFAETGTRQYSFLMYRQTGKGFSVKNLPSTGAPFDAQKFQSDNGLKAPVAGVVMVVDLDGTSPESGAVSSSAPPATTTAAAASSTPYSTSPATLTTTTVIMRLPSTSGASSTADLSNSAPTPTGNAGASSTSSGTPGVATVTGSSAISHVKLSWTALQIALGAVGIALFMV